MDILMGYDQSPLYMNLFLCYYQSQLNDWFQQKKIVASVISERISVY